MKKYTTYVVTHARMCEEQGRPLTAKEWDYLMRVYRVHFQHMRAIESSRNGAMHEMEIDNVVYRTQMDMCPSVKHVPHHAIQMLDILSETSEDDEPEYCDDCGEDMDDCDCDLYHDDDDLIDGVGFMMEGSALRAATPDNPRNLPCPNCERPNMLTPIDVQRGYQCDHCADLAERGGY